MGRSHSFKVEMSRLVAAAVVNRTFCHTLLSNPAQALRGYCNEKFDFTPDERTLILAIRAATLQEFAEEVVKLTDGTDRKGS